MRLIARMIGRYKNAVVICIFIKLAASPDIGMLR